MDALTALGVISTGAAILFYHLEPRHSGWVLAFAAASLSSSIYAFLQGAWPFGVAELFWVAVAMHRYSLLWRRAPLAYVPGALPVALAPAVEPPHTEVAAAVVPAARPPSHCHAGYPLRLVNAPAPVRGEYRTAAFG